MDRLRQQIKKLIEAINRLDLKEEEKKIGELEAWLTASDEDQAQDQEKLRGFLKHYEKILSIQKTLGPDIRQIQEFLDKNG